VLFLDVSTPLPRTTQAFASLFTSQPPSEHGVEEIGERLGPCALTLAEILSAAGYRTAAVSANGVAGPLQGLDQGFAVFVDAIPIAGDRWRSARDARFKLIRIPELPG
jgi:arylsulfatase A-like enzyme